ncbi:hypothetical protein Bbelb_237430 [Branchiostoma belcheri]|nr:hypothetical protein Bbelb_237430 [Branchiostoma belcheri]
MEDERFFQAVWDGDVETVRRSLEEGVNVNMRLQTYSPLGWTGDTALHVACREGRDEVVKLLIKNQADLNVTNGFGVTGLHVACRQGHDKVVELLIKNQADLNVTNGAGDTGLHVACRGGHDEVAELLIENQADLNLANGNGDTGLHAACRGGHVKVVELLIKNQADLNMANKFGVTGLHVACREGHDKVVELLIKNQSDVNVANVAGDTCLHVACRGGHEKVVELLIKNQADLNATNKDGATGLHVACSRGHDEVVELLIKNQADLNVTNKFGDTGLHVACIMGHVKVVELLIKNQADLNVTNGNGDTGLHVACRQGHDEVVELLIKNQADLNVTNGLSKSANVDIVFAGDTGLHVACSGGDVKVMELLIKNKADLNVTNKKGDTALHVACTEGHDKVVELLIRNRADLLITNKDDKRPVDSATRLDRSTRLLIETETRKQAEYGELVSSQGSEEETTVKLFLSGDGQVGKTSLRAILEKTGFFPAVLWNIRMMFRKDEFNPTAGVHVSRKHVKGIGRLSLHDFAGQAQFYVTHAMLLRTTNAIFPVVYKITDGEEEQERQVHGWLSFINCSNPDPTNIPRVVLIASHADKLQDKRTGLRRAEAMVDHYRKLFEGALVVSPEVFLMNCLKAGSADIRRLRDVLSAFKEVMLEDRQAVPKVCVQLMSNLARWREERDTFPVLQWEEYLSVVQQDISDDVTERTVQLASSYLHDIGEWLYTSVFGKLLAPDNFPIDNIQRTAEDHVTYEELKRVFDDVADIPPLIKLLQDFQLCHTFDGHTFILPSLLQQEIDERAWSPVSGKAVYFGMQIRYRTEIDSFSCDLFPRLQTLLMQAHPDKLSKPRLWKNSAKCTDGKAEALLQISQDKRRLNIFVRSNDGDREDCKSIMDLLADMAYKLLHETSPGARSQDMVLSALDLREHSPQPHAYSREEVEEAAAKGENVVHPQRKVPEKVKDLLLHLEHLEMDERAWSLVSAKAVYVGVQIRCCSTTNSFSCDLFPRLKNVLTKVHPDKLSEPLLWKNSAKCTDGKAEALLQISQDKRRLNIFVRSNDGDREDCNSIMDLLTDMAYKLLHETSPGARSQDMVLSALDLREHSPQPHAYSREEVEEAAAKGENVVHPQRKVPEKVKDLLLHLEHLEMDERAWSLVSAKAVYVGVQIRCCSTTNSFSCDLFPRLKNVLTKVHPDKLSEPLLWKNSAKCTDGKAEALLQISQDKRRLNIFVRSNDGDREDCNSIMDLLIDMAYKLLHETSPGARSQDMVLSALDLREHSPQPHAYSREEVEEAAAKGENVVHPQRKVPEKVKDLLLHLGKLKGMLGRVARKRAQLVETLRHISPILDHLRADDVISLEENDRIRAARTPQDAARELLDMLETKGEQACTGFHKALKQVDQFAASLLE